MYILYDRVWCWVAFDVQRFTTEKNILFVSHTITRVKLQDAVAKLKRSINSLVITKKWFDSGMLLFRTNFRRSISVKEFLKIVLRKLNEKIHSNSFIHLFQKERFYPRKCKALYKNTCIYRAIKKIARASTTLSSSACLICLRAERAMLKSW